MTDAATRLTALAERIELWPVDRLRPYERNPRTHSEDQVAQLAASMVEFGFTNPILVDETNGILAGHGRLMAARQLGLAEVPVVRLEHLSEAQKRAYIIADNQLAACSRPGTSSCSPRRSAGCGTSGSISTCWASTPPSWSGCCRSTAATRRRPSPRTRCPSRPRTRSPGRAICGCWASTACSAATPPCSTDVERVLGGALADMAWTDPPYNVDYGNTSKDKQRGKGRKILNDNLGDGFEAFLTDACTNLVSVTKGAIYIAMSSSELHTLQRAFAAAGGKWSTFVIWAKHTFTLGRADYQRQYEPILYGWREGSDHYWCGARDQGDVWFFDKPAKNDLHPTMKPVALVERAIRNSSKTRDIVLDVFGGSGSTLIAAEKTGRQARLVELDPAYGDVIVQRWQRFTGRAATLDGDGRSFDEIAAARCPAAA